MPKEIMKKKIQWRFGSSYTYTSHRHPAFLCYIDLYVTIESGDIIHNVTITPKVLAMAYVQIIIEATRSIELGWKSKTWEHYNVIETWYLITKNTENLPWLQHCRTLRVCTSQCPKFPILSPLSSLLFFYTCDTFHWL